VRGVLVAGEALRALLARRLLPGAPTQPAARAASRPPAAAIAMQYSPARAGSAIIYNFSPDCMRAVTRSSGVLFVYVIVVLNILNLLKRCLCSAHVTKRDQRRGMNERRTTCSEIISLSPTLQLRSRQTGSFATTGSDLTHWLHPFFLVYLLGTGASPLVQHLSSMCCHDNYK
jgi:hypothetical protein